MKRREIVCIIPARYGSSRFPGKVLQPLGRKTVLQWVYETALATEGISSVIVATDDERIAGAVTDKNVRVILTSPECRSGSERVAEVLRSISAEWVIHLQADEPFLLPEHLEPLVDYADFTEARVATLARRMQASEEVSSPHRVKVVTRQDGCALYFSRHPIPFQSEEYLIHIGVYAYLPEILHQILSYPPAPSEQAENLEQLRFLHYRIPIRVFIVDGEFISIDTPQDLEQARLLLSRKARGGG
ncbi:MAG: 3-deoxy-manno-octulosonate cytidylyltransferase [bacterium JZ-2024 1]